MSDPRKTHLADQLGASLRHTAKMLGEYRDELLAQGFPEEQVARMVERLEGLLLPEEGLLRLERPGASTIVIALRHLRAVWLDANGLGAKLREGEVYLFTEPGGTGIRHARVRQATDAEVALEFVDSPESD